MKFIRWVMIIFAGYCVTLPTYAGTYQSKAWAWNDDGNSFFFAATVNSGGRTLGQYCYLESHSCLYLVDIGLSCEKGHRYPALINSSKGANATTLICAKKVAGRSVFAVDDFKSFDRLVRTARRIGVVVPLKGGKFQVTRFSLSGSTNAVNRMRDAARDKSSKNIENSGSPDNQVL